MEPDIDRIKRRTAPPPDRKRRHKRRRRSSSALRVGIATVAVTAIAATIMVVAANRSNSSVTGGAVSTAATGTATGTGSPAPSAASSKSASAAPTATVSAVTPAAFTAAVQAVVSAAPGHGAVAVTDLSTGAAASFSDNGHLFDTGSIVKLDILSTLLYQKQQAGTTLTASEESYATTMIENSNNDSANSLFFDEGGVAAITAANKVFGLTGTTVEYHWGTTTTDPTEQMKLLKQIFTSDSVLSATSRAYIQGLMSKVESDQQWGVSAAASPGTSYMLKNGWLPNSAGLWTINSVGEVTYDGHLLLIAVQTDDDSSTMDVGVDFAQQIAAAAAKSLVTSE
jgi:hypothetical protein